MRAVIFLLSIFLFYPGHGQERILDMEKQWEELSEQGYELYYKGQFAEAALTFEEAYEYVKNNLGTENPGYLTTLGNLANIYTEDKQYEKALIMHLERLSYLRSTFGKNNLDYTYALNDLATLYVAMKDLKRAGAIYNEIIDKQLKILIVKKGFNKVLLYNNLGNFNKELGAENDATLFYQEGLKEFFSYINSNFPYNTSDENEDFLRKHYFIINNSLFHYADVYDGNPEVAGEVFNLVLSTKGAVLNSGIDLKERMMKIQEPALKDSIYEILELKERLARRYNEDIYDIETSELEMKLQKLESKIYSRTMFYGSGKGISEYKWEDLQKSLKKDEVLVEFFTMYNHHSDLGKLYFALILKKDYAYPVWTFLFEENDLNKILEDRRGDSEIYNQNNKKFYNLIWQPIDKYLKKHETIYFSPAENLHQISFSAIPTPDGRYLSEKYKLHRLSSIINIMEKEQAEKIRDIALFGDIDYDLRYDRIAAKRGVRQNDGDRASGPLKEKPIGERENWQYLPGTLHEIEEIKELAEQSGILVTSYSGDNALEDNFKNLSGSDSPQIIHIATHGFFYPNSEKLYVSDLTSLAIERFNSFKNSNNPLYRAGLLFAGANHGWNGEKISYDIDDGILTAYEINNSYLPNTELVVLSACDTGLGEIRGSEGVYGLQRAFKSAGAKYLLMSLWKVSDKDTAEFMEVFYRNLFKTNSIYDSYIKVQTEMRRKYYNEPKKWASFILLY